MHGNRPSRRRRPHIASLLVATILLMLPAVPAMAHGDHDARPLLRKAEAGPYLVSLWQVYPDVGSAMLPHLIVTFDVAPDGSAPVPSVEVGEETLHVMPSTTTPGAWETMVGLETDDLLSVTISDPDGSWTLPTVRVPPPLTSLLPMRALIMISIFLATAVAWWAAGRTARAWRRPLHPPPEGLQG